MLTRTKLVGVASLALAVWMVGAPAAEAQSYRGFRIGRYQGQITNTTGNASGSGKGDFDILSIAADGAVRAHLREYDGLEGEGDLSGAIDGLGVMRLRGNMTSPSDRSVWQSAILAVIVEGTLRFGNSLSLAGQRQEETSTMTFSGATPAASVAPQIAAAPAPGAALAKPPARPARTSTAPTAATAARPGAAAPTLPPPVRAATYRIPDRVEVQYDGTWYPGSIYAVRDGAYKVLRDGYTSDDRWVTAADLRPYTAPARPTATSDGRLPRSVPLGTYECSSFTSSGARSFFGQIRITGNGQYTALARDVAGAPSRFTYDPASGAITWAGGKLQGFFGTVTGSGFGYDTQGTAMITVSYVVQPGGNGFDLTCNLR